jgi:hypothetical protein
MAFRVTYAIPLVLGRIYGPLGYKSPHEQDHDGADDGATNLAPTGLIPTQRFSKEARHERPTMPRMVVSTNLRACFSA